VDKALVGACRSRREGFRHIRWVRYTNHIRRVQLAGLLRLCGNKLCPGRSEPVLRRADWIRHSNTTREMPKAVLDSGRNRIRSARPSPFVVNCDRMITPVQPSLGLAPPSPVGRARGGDLRLVIQVCAASMKVSVNAPPSAAPSAALAGWLASLQTRDAA